MPRGLGKGSVAIDTVPLPEKVKLGKVLKSGGKYVLQVDRRKMELPVGLTMSDGEIRKLAGKEVYVAFSMKNPREVVAIGTWPTPEDKAKFKIVCVLCYLPAPETIRGISPKVREGIISEMARAKIISPELEKALFAGM